MPISVKLSSGNGIEQRPFRVSRPTVTFANVTMTFCSSPLARKDLAYLRGSPTYPNTSPVDIGI